MSHQEIIYWLLIFGRHEILKEFRADSCIASTAIGIDVLNYFGIISEPLPVKLIVFNAPCVKRIEKNNFFPSHELLIQWGKEDGSYNLGIGYGNQEYNKWIGHLVILAENKWLIDLSIDQANRPEHDILLNPYVTEVDKSFLDDNKPKIIKCQNGCVIRINKIDDQGFLSSPDWIFESRRKHLVDRIIQKIEEKKNV